MTITKGTRIYFPDPFEAMDRLPAPPPLPREIRQARAISQPPPPDWDIRDTEPAPPPHPEDDDT